LLTAALSELRSETGRPLHALRARREEGSLMPKVRGKPLEAPPRSRPRLLASASFSRMAYVAECRACSWSCVRESPEEAQSAGEAHALSCKWRRPA
jgi:hypothetical protein